MKDLAAALGISASMVSRLRRRGMPIDSVERAERWRRRHLEPGRVMGQHLARHRDPPPPATATVEAIETRPPGAAAPSEPSPYLDGLDDGWRAAFETVQAFVLLYGIARFGPCLVALLAAMPTEAVMGLPLNEATQPIDDVWDEIEAECARLVASGRVNGAQP